MVVPRDCDGLLWYWGLDDLGSTLVERCVERAARKGTPTKRKSPAKKKRKPPILLRCFKRTCTKLPY